MVGDECFTIIRFVLGSNESFDKVTIKVLNQIRWFFLNRDESVCVLIHSTINKHHIILNLSLHGKSGIIFGKLFIKVIENVLAM